MLNQALFRPIIAVFTPQLPITFWPFAAIILILSLLAFIARLKLYNQLQITLQNLEQYIRNPDSYSQPPVLQELQQQYKYASTYLEQVNTVALVEKIYSKQKLGNIVYEKIENFCRLIPNLLIALGLMGTFLGISLNLKEINEILTHSNNINPADFNKPLEAMGLAFSTSLLGLFCSFILTLSYTWLNTGLLRNQLIYLIEDYLDNYFQTKVEGNTRLDKLIKNMSEQFKDFLTNFGETVRRSVEEAVKDNFDKVSKANVALAEQASELYTRFNASAGTMANSADQFRQSANTLKEVETRFSAPFVQAAATLAQTQKELSQAAATLNTSVQTSQESTLTLYSAAQGIVQLAESANVLNEQTGAILDRTQTNQDHLATIIPQLNQGAESFRVATENIESLRQKIDLKEDKLSEIQIALQNLVSNITDTTAAVRALAEDYQQRLSDLVEITNQGYQNLQVEFTDIKTHTANLDTNLVNITTQGYQNIQTELAVIKNHAASVDTKFDGTRAELLASIKNNLEQLSKAFIAMITQLNKTIDGSSNKQTESLNKQLIQCVEQLQKLDQGNEELQKRFIYITNYLDKLDSIISSINTTTEAANGLGDRLVQSLEGTAKGQSQLLTSLVDQCISQLRDLRREAFTLRQVYEASLDDTNQTHITP